MRTAARVAKTFGMDPVDVYAETDVTKWLSRVAAYGVIAKDQQDAQNKR